MKIEMQNDQPVINATDIGSLLRLSPAVVQDAMHRGAITSRDESDQDADAGRFRVTFYADVWLSVTCTEDGGVISHSRTTVEKNL